MNVSDSEDKKQEINYVIEELGNRLEDLIAHYISVKRKQETIKRFQNFRSFGILFLSVVIVLIASQFLIGDIKCEQPTGCLEFAPWGVKWKIPGESLTISLIFSAIIGIFPLSYIAYSYYKSEIQKERLADDLKLLGLVSKENIDEIYQLYNTVYNPFQFGVYIILFVFLSFIIFVSYYKVSTGTEYTFIQSSTVRIIFYAFLGSYFFGIQLLVRRYNTFDLQPQVYSAVILRTLLSAVITFSIASLIGGITTEPLSSEKSSNSPTSQATSSSSEKSSNSPTSQATSSSSSPSNKDVYKSNDKSSIPWQVLAFLIGIFPTSGIRWITFVTNRSLSAPIDQYNESPLKNISGINTWHEARLSELGIDSVQSLATTDICKLLLSTQFDTQQIINWVDQAILYMKLGSKTPRLQEININTFHEMQISLNKLQRSQKTSNKLQLNQNLLQNNCSPNSNDEYSRILTILGLSSAEQIEFLKDYSNYPNYTHIQAYYMNAAERARQRADEGRQSVLNSGKQFALPDNLLAQNEEEESESIFNKNIVTLNILNQEIKELEIRLKFKPNAKDYVNLGTGYYLISCMEDAEEAYDMAISLDRTLAEAYNNISVIFIYKKQYELALKNIGEALRIDSNFVEALLNLGLVHLRENDVSSAIDSFSQALTINPRIGAAYCNRGIAYNTISKGPDEFKKAVADFEKAYLLGYDDSVALWNAWGLSLSGLERYQEAIEKYDRAIQLSRNNSALLHARRAHTYASLGRKYFVQDNQTEVINCYLRADSDFIKATKTENTPAIVFANYGLLKVSEGDFKSEQGRNDEAKRLYEKAIEQYLKAKNILEPQDKNTQNNFSTSSSIETNFLSSIETNLAGAYQRVGEHEKALECLESAIKYGDNSVTTLYNYAFSLYVTEKNQDALKNLEQIKKLLEVIEKNSPVKKLEIKVEELITNIQTKMNQNNTAPQ
ncbi:tetratricopeptide repeat protein [Nostoc sp. DSM 114161]|uniref:tetratricopeptide repeat protein n=1 Tax=Nostoc sp. DSM 114161 TaxID=3440143 RepID=UPI004045EDF6